MTRTQTKEARRRWSEAHDMADLGTLTAEWLMGELSFLPGYGGAPDPETADLVPVLVSLNCHRFVTIGSQPAWDETIDGVRWRQRAAVDLLAWDERLADHLVKVSRAAGLRVIDNGPARRWRDDPSTAIPVTTRGGHLHTGFGTHLSRGTLSRCIFPGVGRYAVRAACETRQITVVDPRWGRTGLLWPTLRRTAEGDR